MVDQVRSEDTKLILSLTLCICGLASDVDECTALPTSCRGGCENTDGSYRCLCPEGYNLSENGYSCNGNKRFCHTFVENGKHQWKVVVREWG